MQIRELATGLQFPEGPVAMDDDSVLLVEIARDMLTHVRYDGLVQVVADLGGGPNGEAIGADGAVYQRCNDFCAALSSTTPVTSSQRMSA